MSYELLKEELRKALEYETPTIAQERAIPEILKGKNLLITAPTGYGKTLTAILPAMNKILEEKEKESNSKGFKALYIAPLRSLNRDIFDKISKLGNKIGIRIEVRHGDTTQNMRRKQSLNPPEILITTPETLQALLVGKNLREHLKKVKTIIIDEVHELINDKRGTQLFLGIERLKELSEFQIIGLSATISNKELISSYLSNDSEVIEIKDKKEYEVKVLKPGADPELAKKLKINQNLAYCIKNIKKELEKQKCLIFTNTRQSTELIGSKLKNLNINIEVHHSSLSKEKRMQTEEKLRKNQLKGVIATSSLELGIDIGSIEKVIQFMSPRQVTKAVQRIGRSGHKINQTSKGLILTINNQDYYESKAITAKMNKWLEPSEIPEKPYDVLAHQIVGLVMNKERTINEIYEIIRKAKSYQNLTKNEIKEMIRLLTEIRLIKKYENGISKTRKGMLYYYENLSMIPDEKSIIIKDNDTKSMIGILHEGFVTNNLENSTSFIMHGEAWKVLEISQDKIMVCRTSTQGAIPSWEGELLPIPKEIARLSAKLKKQDIQDLIIQEHQNYVILNTPNGTKTNETIKRVIGSLLTSQTSTVQARSDAYKIIFKLPKILNKKTIIQTLKTIKPEWVLEIITRSVKNSSTYPWNFAITAKRFGILKKNAEYSPYRIKQLTKLYENTLIEKETIKAINQNQNDVKGAYEFFKNLKNIKYEEPDSETINQIQNQFGEYLTGRDYNEILEIVKERLHSKRYNFKCLACKKELGSYEAKNANLKCSCGSKLITFYTPGEEPSEKRANLYLNYGNKSCIVMAGRGIGNQNATRILGKPGLNEETLIKEIIDAERTYTRTKQYWKT